MPQLPLRALREALASLLGSLRRARGEADGALSRRLAAIAPPSSSDQPAADVAVEPDSLPSPLAGRVTPALTGARWGRPSPYVAAVIAVALAAAFVAALAYYGARKFTSDAAETRAAEEAHSLAASSAYTATGDAFSGYLQMLGYADDPVVASPTSSAADRRAALDYLVKLNTNKLQSLAIVSLDGVVVYASTDPTITGLRDSEALNRTRASLGPTNSDIILPEGATRGYVEFTTPLRQLDGHVWAVLYGRADPDKLWSATLRGSVDGSRNVIINSEGLFAAGVPEDMLRLPWRGAPLDNGSVAANILGVESICGLGPIGRGSQIDHGWHVASCLPASLVQVEANRAMGQQALVTSAGAAMAVVIAAGLLRFAFDGGTPARQSKSDDETVSGAAFDDAPPTPVAIESTEEPPAVPVPDPNPEATSEPPSAEPHEPSVVLADVEATQLIGAYERRAARLSERLRESVQARLMIAQTQAAEAFRIIESSPVHARELHQQALEELQAVRDGELRALAQELHPGLVRLGLPGALRAMAKELAASLDIELAVDPDADGVAGGGRRGIEADRRLVIFRAVRGALDALRAYGAERCALALDRDGDWLRLRIESETSTPPDESLSAADVIAFQAYGGKLSWSVAGEAVAFTGDLPAPATSGDGDAPSADEWPDDDDDAAPAVHVFAAPLEAPGESLAASLRDLAHELAPEIAVSVNVDDDSGTSGVLPGDAAGALRMLAGTAARTLAAAGASSCELTLRIEPDVAAIDVRAVTPAHDLPESAFDDSREAIESLGGTLTIGVEGEETTVVGSVPSAPQADEPPAVVQLPSPPSPEATSDAA